MLCTRINEVLFVLFILKKLAYKDCGFFFFLNFMLKSQFKSLLKLNILLMTFYMLKLNFNRL
jgi:hypothetical protein